MFNRFFTTKPTGQGTGLGLSITHDIIVKQHGGRIDVDTEPGAFTELVITLPRDNGTAARQKLCWFLDAGNKEAPHAQLTGVRKAPRHEVAGG